MTFAYSEMGETMNEIEMALMRHKKRVIHEQIEQDDKKISRIFTKVLLSIILVLACTIYIKLSPENLEVFKSSVFESNLTFTKINNWYSRVFGSILPSFREPDSEMVSAHLDNPLKREDYLDGYKLFVSPNTPVKTIASGLLVYLGEKENYGNVAIIQGVDGVDIWYGNIVDTDLKMYDYVEQNTILGNTKEDFYYLAFASNGTFLTYDEYFDKI